MLLRLLAASCMLMISSFTPHYSEAASIDANAFTWTDPTGQGRTANDFRLRISDTFTNAPKSDVFPNNNFSSGTNNVTFSGNSLNSGSSHNVKFLSDGNRPRPIGAFSINNTIVSGEVKSKALDGTVVALGPAPTGGVLATVNVFNDYSSLLTGSVTVSINTGFSSHFNLDEFDTLRAGSRLLLPSTAYSFNVGQGISPITTTFFSSDEYLLITGTANAADGAGSFPFASAVSSPVPEPTTLILFGTGLLSLFASRARWIKKSPVVD